MIWPQHFLKDDIPNARIIAYGYHEKAGWGDYEADANHLCGKLKEMRSEDIVRRSPFLYFQVSNCNSSS